MGACGLYRIAVRLRALGTFSKGGISISQADGDAPFDLLAMLIGPNPRKRFDQGCLSVVNMANHSYVDLRLFSYVFFSIRFCIRLDFNQIEISLMIVTT
jgi:hypothetical protein